jgi:hypothetical protein
VHDRGRNSTAPQGVTSSLFAARIEMPVVLRGGMLDDRPAMVPVGATDAAPVRVPRRLGAMGWVAATVICAGSVYAVRDTMFAPLAKSEAPSSAWETRHAAGATTVPLIAATGSIHLDLEDHDDSPTGTTATADDAQVDQIAPVNATGSSTEAGSTGASAGASTGSANVEATTSTADVTTSSTASTAPPDTLGGHGGNAGGGKGGSGSGSGTP